MRSSGDYCEHLRVPVPTARLWCESGCARTFLEAPAILTTWRVKLIRGGSRGRLILALTVTYWQCLATTIVLAFTICML